jgi:hypothetical protein
MRESTETVRAGDAPPFRWWTFGALIVYTAALLVFCAVVTVKYYSPGDAVLGRLTAASPPHLPIASFNVPPFNVAPFNVGSFNVAHVELGATAPRWVCYQLSD